MRFALKDVWDQRAVERFRYDAEFPDQFQFWMKRQGADGDSRTNAQKAANVPVVTWSQAYWRAHWANVSPSQAFEMFQRLRPDRIADLGRNIPGLRAFTFEDLSNVLKINDYPVPYRPQLAAIAYHKPRLVDIDRFYLDGSISEDEVYEMHLDLGYSPKDARLRTDWLVSKEAKKAAGTDPRKLAQLYAQMYANGHFTREWAFGEMSVALTSRRMMMNRDDNPSETLIRLWDKIGVFIEAKLAQVDAERQVRRSKLLQAAYRRQYLRGMLTAGELVTDMLATGFVQPWIDQFIAEMNAELASGRLLLSTSKIRRLVSEGILPIETATKYLKNLGWKAPELGYLIGQIKRDLDIESAKQAERLADDAYNQEQARLRQLRAAQRARDEVVRKLNRQESPATLKKYFVRGIITEGDFQRELERRGFDNENVKRQIQAARIERANWLAKQRDRNAASGPGPGPASGTPQTAAPSAPQPATTP